MWGQYMFQTDIVNETADVTDMSGDATVANQSRGFQITGGSPSRSLIVLWFAALGLYAFIGWFFRGQRQ